MIEIKEVKEQDLDIQLYSIYDEIHKQLANMKHFIIYDKDVADCDIEVIAPLNFLDRDILEFMKGFKDIYSSYMDYQEMRILSEGVSDLVRQDRYIQEIENKEWESQEEYSNEYNHAMEKFMNRREGLIDISFSVMDYATKIRRMIAEADNNISTRIMMLFTSFQHDSNQSTYLIRDINSILENWDEMISMIKSWLNQKLFKASQEMEKFTKLTEIPPVEYK